MAKNKIFAALAIILVIVTCVLCNIGASAITVKEEVEETVFYDTSACEVVGCEAEAEGLWMLNDGKYTVLFHDGTTMGLAVNNGSWEFVTP